MSSTFERPETDLAKIVQAWDTWERGEESPGKTMTNMKKAGLDQLLRELKESGWQPQSVG
jgi:hypothetical protein